jgi:hypothetical protein
MSGKYKLCPNCREEYTVVPTECVDCRVPLVFDHEIEPEIAAEEFPQIDELECLRLGPLPWSQALSSALGEVQIGHRIEPDTRSEEEGGLDPRLFDGATIFGVWVRPADLEAAQEVSTVVFAHVDGREEDAPDAAIDEECPACQSPLATDASECPDCGLSFA